ncbi:MAG: prepilin-type N-terminal cleavage/methylation domain-containing protein [Burkholderiaceae bacterium]
MADARMPARHGLRGFTLIETVIAIGVIALLMSVALPSFGEMMARARLRGAAEDLAFGLGNARLESLRPGAGLQHVTIQAGDSWCWASGPAPHADCRGSAPGANKLVHADEYPGVTMTEGTSLQFDGSQPLAGSTLAAVFVSAQGQTLRVHMTPLGRASICAQDVRIADYPVC